VLPPKVEAALTKGGNGIASVLQYFFGILLLLSSISAIFIGGTATPLQALFYVAAGLMLLPVFRKKCKSYGVPQSFKGVTATILALIMLAGFASMITVGTREQTTEAVKADKGTAMTGQDEATAP